MGNSVTQNSQRGLIFVTFLTCIFFFIITVVNFCKNRIDPVEDDDDAAADKYKEGEGEERDKDKPKKAAPKKELGK